MCVAQVITKLMLADSDLSIQLKLLLTKTENVFTLLAYVKNDEYSTLLFHQINTAILSSVIIPPRFVNTRAKNTNAIPGERQKNNHLMQRVHCIHLVIMVFTNGPMFLSSTARFPSKNRLLSLPNIMDWSLSRLQKS